MLTALLSDVPGLRMLILEAQRPGWSAPWSTWGWPERITLRPLAAQDAAALAGAVLGGLRLSPELEQYVADRAGGNPFFVEEMLRAHEESGGLARRDGVAYLVAGAAERLPSTLTEVLLARLDRLDTQVTGVAQVGSVIGRSFAVVLLAQVMERDAAALELPLSAPQQAEIAFPKRGSDLEYVFKHVSMREVAYNTLVQKRRQELHLHTAQAIAALYPANEYLELIAYHYSKTDQHREAGEWLERAGDRAAGVYANETAIASYEEARRRLERAGASQTVLARIHEKIGAALHTVARFDDALRVLERAVEIYQQTQDLEAVGRVTARIGRVHRDRGTVDDGVTRLLPLLDLVGWNGPSPGFASLQVALAHLYFAGGRYDECVAAAERAAGTARAIGDDGLLAAAEMRLGSMLYMLGRPEEGIETLESAARRAEAVGDLDVLSIAVSNLGEAYVEAGMLERGRANIERALQTAERVGELASMGYSLVTIGWILYLLGQWDEAEDSIVHGASVIRTVGSSWYSAYAPLQVGRLKLAQGAWEDAARNLNECVAIADPIGDIQALQGAHRLLGELEMLEGRPAATIARLEPLEETDPLPDMIGLLAILAWERLETGSAAQAEQTVARAVDIARARGHKPLLPEALRIRAMIRDKQGQEEEAEADFASAVSVARTLPYPYGEARMLYEWGLMSPQREQPERREAGRAHLDEALAIFRRLGATKDAERTEQALREH